jgi:hypothetical protein
LLAIEKLAIAVKRETIPTIKRMVIQILRPVGPYSQYRRRASGFATNQLA